MIQHVFSEMLHARPRLLGNVNEMFDRVGGCYRFYTWCENLKDVYEELI